MIDSGARVRRLWFDEGFLKIPKSFFYKFDLSTNVYLCALIEWHHYLLKERKIGADEKFFMTRKLIQFRVGLTENQQRASIKKLKDMEIIIVEKRGLPPINYYKINYEEIEKLLQKALQTGEINLNNGGKLTSTMELKQPVLYNKKEEDSNESSNKNSPNGLYWPDGQKQSPRLLLRADRSPIEIPPKRQRPDVMRIVSYWNSSPGLPKLVTPDGTKSETKTFLDVVRTVGEVLDGTFKKDWDLFTEETIFKAIDEFKRRRTDINYAPINKNKLKGINLPVFFWNPFSTNNPSQFMDCLDHPTPMVKTLVNRAKEDNPQLTQGLQRAYVKLVLSGQDKEFSQQEINRFIKGANLLNSRIESLRKRAIRPIREYEFCEASVKSIAEAFPNSVHLGNISNEMTYEELLPRYLAGVGKID
jgi:hypothetical protein